jgi:hypothetical protein
LSIELSGSNEAGLQLPAQPQHIVRVPVSAGVAFTTLVELDSGVLADRFQEGKARLELRLRKRLLAHQALVE